MAQPAAKTVAFYFDVVSPWSYMAARQLPGIMQRAGARLVTKPVFLGGILKEANASFLKGQVPAKKKYNTVDMQRCAAMSGTTIKIPPFFPTKTITAMRCLIAAGEPAHLPLAMKMWEAQFSEGLDIGTEDGLRRVLLAAGYSEAAAGQLLMRAASAEVRSLLAEETSAAVRRGLFGVPTLCIDGQPEFFWGQDRLPQLEMALGSRPLRPLPFVSYALVDRRPPSRTEFFFDFSSPFSYVAFARAQAYFGPDALVYRPFLLGGLFKSLGSGLAPLLESGAAKQTYQKWDLARAAAEAGVALHWPSRFPLRTLQPLRLVLAAQEAQCSRTQLHELVERIFAALWTRDADPDSRAMLEQCCSEAGLDGPTLLAAASERAKTLLHEATAGAQAAGLFGAPAFVVHDLLYGPQLFWGNDRLEMAVEAARGNRLAMVPAASVAEPFVSVAKL